jgi:uncharacterized protein
MFYQTFCEQENRSGAIANRSLRLNPPQVCGTIVPMNSRINQVSPSTIVKCPACGGKSLYAPSNAFRPFCSERCKDHDLGAWANEQFRVAADTPPYDGTVTAPSAQILH